MWLSLGGPQESTALYLRWDHRGRCCEVLLNRLIDEDSEHILEVKRHVLGLLEKDSKTRGYTAA